ncbi:hypothetical protein GCM10023096_58910 [Nonomuraea ferruginea]
MGVGVVGVGVAMGGLGAGCAARSVPPQAVNAKTSNTEPAIMRMAAPLHQKLCQF